MIKLKSSLFLLLFTTVSAHAGWVCDEVRPASSAPGASAYHVVVKKSLLGTRLEITNYAWAPETEKVYVKSIPSAPGSAGGWEGSGVSLHIALVAPSEEGLFPGSLILPNDNRVEMACRFH